jgi:hypothetical protein
MAHSHEKLKLKFSMDRVKQYAIGIHRFSLLYQINVLIQKIEGLILKKNMNL